MAPMSWLALHIYFRSFVLLALFMGGMQVLFIIPPSMSNGTWWVPDPVSLGLGFAFPTGVMAFAVTHRIMEWMNQRAYRYGTPLPRSSDLGWVTRRRRA